MRWLIRLLFILAPLEVNATSGAQLLQAPVGFSDGYAWGALEVQIAVAQPGGVFEPWQKHWVQCLTNAGVTSDVFGEAVRRELREDPSLLALPGFFAVNQTAAKICGPIPQ